MYRTNNNNHWVNKSFLQQLYEEQKAENEKLRKDLKKLQQELSETKQDLERVRMRSEPSRSSDTAAERKVSD